MLLVFSYGSNLSTARITERVGPVEVVAVAWLGGHALRFHKRGRDGSGKADAHATGAATDRVWGVVHALDLAAKRTLDDIEGVGCHYLEQEVRVWTRDGRSLDATTYVAAPDRIAPRLAPFAWYREHVLTGAREHDLPDDYIARIRAVPVWQGGMDGQADAPGRRVRAATRRARSAHLDSPHSAGDNALPSARSATTRR